MTSGGTLAHTSMALAALSSVISNSSPATFFRRIALWFITSV